MKRAILATLAIAAIVGCAKEESTNSDVSSDIEATFANSAIGVVSRTTANSWEAQDEVGIFMYKSATTDNTYELAKENTHYISDATGKFTVDLGESPIYYPQSDMVDFYAYYPYQKTMVGTTYSADITAQNTSTGGFDQGAVDFMTASLMEKYKSEESLTFDFTHRLAMLTLSVTPKFSVEAKPGILKGVTVTVEEINTQATFNALTGAYIASGDVVGKVSLLTEETTVNSDGDVTLLTATAIVIPETISSTAKITITFSDGTSHSALFSANTAFAAGKNHTFNVKAGYDGVAFESETGNTISEWDENSSISKDPVDAEEL